MGKGKPRTAIHRKVNKKLAKLGTECEWWDGGCPECILPWSHSKGNGCNGNPFVCEKLYNKYLASVNKEIGTIVEEFVRRNNVSET